MSAGSRPVCLAEQRADAAHNRTGASALLHNLLRGRRRLLRIDRLGAQPLAAGICVRHHRSKRLVQLMCNRRRHLRHAHRARKPRQVFLRENQVLLGAVLLLDIDMNSVPTRNSSVLPIAVECCAQGTIDKHRRRPAREPLLQIGFPSQVHLAIPANTAAHLPDARSGKTTRPPGQPYCLPV